MYVRNLRNKGKPFKFPKRVKTAAEKRAIVYKYEGYKLCTDCNQYKDLTGWNTTSFFTGKGMRGLDNSGASNGMARLSEDEVRLYREAFDKGLMSKKDIVNKTRMLPKAVREMLNAKTYANVPYRRTRSTRSHD